MVLIWILELIWIPDLNIIYIFISSAFAKSSWNLVQWHTSFVSLVIYCFFSMAHSLMVLGRCLVDIFDRCCNFSRVLMLCCGHWPEWTFLGGLALHSTAFGLGFANTGTNPHAQCKPKKTGDTSGSLISSASPGYYLGAAVTKICPSFPCQWGHLLHPSFPVAADVPVIPL